MALKLNWAPEAREDIKAIASYIERDSPWYARIIVTKIIETAKDIPGFPAIGRIVPEIADNNIRERFVYSYRLIYRIETSRIVIAAVIHGSRLLDPLNQRIEKAEA